MRISELSTRISSISRREGRSATAAAAYRACCAIHCQRENRLHDYSRKRGLEVSAIVAPKGSPAWVTDRDALWNAAELRERNGKRGPNAGQFKAAANPAREFMFAFPAELSQAGRLDVAETVARHLAAAHGIVADFSIHLPGREGDERNVHCHMLTTTRRMTADGLGAKAREWDALASGARLAKQFRAFLAATMNDALAAEGQDSAVFVEHRSFKDRGGTQRPQKHLGPGRTNALRRTIRQSRQAWLSANAQQQRDRHAKERAALVAHQQSALRGKLRALADREHRAIAALTASSHREPIAEKPGMLQRLTTIFGRQAAPEVRPEAAHVREQQVASQTAAIKAEIQAEQAAYVADQVKERQALDDRHAADDRQLDAATGHRVAHDRLVEQQHRRDSAHDRADRQPAIEQDHGRTRGEPS